MRLEKLQDYLRRKGWEYRYTEEAGCGSIGWEYRGLMYHVWEFSEDGAKSNVRIAGKMEDYTGNYEEKIIEKYGNNVIGKRACKDGAAGADHRFR